MAGGCGRVGKKRGATARDSLVGHSAIKLGIRTKKKRKQERKRGALGGSHHAQKENGHL